MRTPGFSLPMTDWKWLARPPGLAGLICCGYHNSGGSVSPGGKANPRGMTPTTVAVRPLTFTSRPAILDAPPNARCHKPSDSTTVSGAPKIPSSGASTRPICGATPSIGIRPPVMFDAVTRIGSALPARFTPVVVYASRYSQEEVSRRRSSSSGVDIQNLRNPPLDP